MSDGTGTDPTRACEDTILVVDDEPSVLGLVSEVLTMEGYRVSVADGARRALVCLKSEPVSLLLTDIRMPGEDGLWMLRVVRSQYPGIPVVMMTGLDDTRMAVTCLREGAADYLGKPLDLEELTIAVRRALYRRRLQTENLRYRRDLEGMVLHRTRELRAALHEKEEAYGMLLEALAQALDAREQDTHNHSLRVAAYTAAMVREMGVSEEELLHIYRGALLHDVGKIGIPDAILLKPGSLSEQEWTVMRSHPGIGARILEGVPYLAGAREIVLCHHERWDGRGYPQGLRGEETPLGARIFAVADTFDVMTSRRPYRDPVGLNAVKEEVDRCSGGQFDPEVAQLFLHMLERNRLIPQTVQTEAIPACMRRPTWTDVSRPRRGRSVAPGPQAVRPA